MEERGERDEGRDERPRRPPRIKLEEINIGDKLTILTKEGRDGRPIGRLTNGRVILISNESPLSVNTGDTVIGEIVHVTKTYLIIMPEKVLGDTDEALMVNLRNVVASGHYQHAILARGLLRILEKEIGR